MHLRTERLMLLDRPDIHPDSHDVRTHITWLNDKELMRYSEQRHRQHTPESQCEYLKGFDNVTSFIWNIIRCEDHLIGTITAYIDHDNEIANVGILIGWPRQGYGTEAWQCVCNWVLVNWVRKVECGCMRSNHGMRRICEKTGMSLEAQRRDHFLFEGKPEDLLLYGRWE